MVTVKSSSLKEFIRLSKGIKTNTIIPVFNYIQCKCIGDMMTLCKSNQETVVTHEIPAEFEQNITFLVDEKMLSAIVSSTQEEVEFSISGNVIQIKSGEINMSLSIPANSLNVYPDPPTVMSDTSYLMSGKMLDEIGMAGSFLSSLENNPLSYCYILPSETGSVVVGTDMHILYLSELGAELPIIVLSQEATSLVSAFESLQYFSCGNYNVFSAGKTTYAFIKPTYHALPYKSVLDRINSDGRIKVDRKELIRFCELSQSVSTWKYTVATLTGSVDGLSLKLTEDTTSVHRDISAEKTFTPGEFNFNTRLMVHVLKSFKSDRVSMQPIVDDRGAAYIIREEQEGDSMGFINGMVK